MSVKVYYSDPLCLPEAAATPASPSSRSCSRWLLIPLASLSRACKPHMPHRASWTLVSLGMCIWIFPSGKYIKKTPYWCFPDRFRSPIYIWDFLEYWIIDPEKSQKYLELTRNTWSQGLQAPRTVYSLFLLFLSCVSVSSGALYWLLRLL